MDTASGEDLADFAVRKIAAGYLARDEVIDAVTDHAAGSVTPGEASALVQGLWDERLEVQARWPKVTDCDRLDSAFAELADAHVLTRQNYGCCLPHGFERLLAEPDAADCVGFAYFAEPDTEDAVSGKGLRVAFGAFGSTATQTPQRRVVAVGEKVVGALRSKGLRVEWDASADDPIWLDLDWQRRMPLGWFEATG